MQLPKSAFNFIVIRTPDGFDIFNATFHGVHIIVETVHHTDIAMCMAARRRLETIQTNIASLSPEDSEYLLRNLPRHWHVRAQIMILSPGIFNGFLSFLQAQDRARPRERPSNMPAVPQSPVRKKVRRKPRPMSRRYFALQVEDAQHQAIRAQFGPPYTWKGMAAGHIGDDWEELQILGKQRLVGWQWFNGYARRVIKTPSRELGMRPLFKREEIAVLKAGLQLDHDEGMSKDVVENEDVVKDEDVVKVKIEDVAEDE